MFQKIKITIILGIVSLGIGSFVWQTNSASTLPLSKIVPLSAELEIKSESGILTWQEYQQIIKKYQDKLDEIKKNCSLDKRCQDGKVNFGALKDKKEIVRTMNKWISENNSLYQK